MPDKSYRPSAGEVRRVLQLIGECRELGDDAAAWQTHLVAGLNRLAGARIGVAGPIPADPRRLGELSGFVDAGDWTSAAVREEQLGYFRHPPIDAHPAAARYLAEPGETLVRVRSELATTAEWRACRARNELFAPGGLDEGLLARTTAPAVGGGFLLTLVRAAGERPFPVRAGRVVELALRELAPDLGRRVWLTHQPNVSGLPPRLRQVLDCLLDGDAEKHVALRLGIARATAHEHVTRLYRHFGVSSRAELLAYFLRRHRRPPGPG